MNQQNAAAASEEAAGGWISWPEAAEIVGCPVPTIEHYAREGHITKRPRRGARPSLLRSSVEEFATRWRDITAAREAARESARQERERTRSLRRQREPKPTSVVPAGLVNSAQAAELLDRDRHHLAYLARTGRMRAQRHGGLWWFDPADVTALRDERTTWISWAAAADLVGCPISAVVAAVHHGAIETRGGRRSRRPSLRRSSVEAWATTWAEQEERRREEAARRQALQRRSKPPEDGHVWLSRTETALVLGVSANQVSRLTRAGKMPATRAGHRHWYRRDHVEQLAAARAFAARRDCVRS